MKNPISKTGRPYWLVGLIALYAVGIPFGSRYIDGAIWYLSIYLLGIFYILLTLISLKSWDKRTLLVILSPIITYPLYVIVGRFLASYIDIELGRTLRIFLLLNFAFCLPYAVFYAFLWRKFWTWIDPKLKKGLVVGFLAITILFFIYTKIALFCMRDSNIDGKGAEEYPSKCEVIDLYYPNDGGNKTQEGIFFWAATSVSSGGPLLILGLLILNYLSNLRIKLKIEMKK